MLRVALVGAGGHGASQHAPSLRRYADEHPRRVDLAAVCDTDADRAGRARTAFGFRQAFTSLDDLCRHGDIDAVVVAVRQHALLPVTAQLLALRVPLAIEKPLGDNLDEAHALVKAIGDAGVPAMVSLNRRFDPALRLAEKWLRDRGPIRYLRGTMLRVNRTEPDFVWGTGIHLLDTLVAMAGTLCLREGGARVVDGRGGCGRVGVLDGPDGLTAAFEILPTAGRVEERLHLSGEGYSVDVWTGSAGPWRVEAYAEGSLVLCERSLPGEPDYLRHGGYAETSAFLDAALAGRPLPAPSPEDALAATELAAQVQSLRNIE